MARFSRHMTQMSRWMAERRDGAVRWRENRATPWARWAESGSVPAAGRAVKFAPAAADTQSEGEVSLREERDPVSEMTSVGSRPQTAIDPSAVFLVLMNDAVQDTPQLQPATMTHPTPAATPSQGHHLDVYA